MTKPISRREKLLTIGPDITIRPGPHFMEDVDFEYDIEVWLSVDSGRVVARELTVRQKDGGPPVTGEVLRQIPLATVVRNLILGVVTVDAYTLTADETARLRDNGPSDETLRAVARTYRLAHAIGTPPTAFVERTFTLPRATAGRWVARARQRGFLDPAEGPGKAGG